MRTRISAVVVATAALSAAPSPARAGTFQVTTCGAAPGNVNNSWVASDTDPGHLQQGTICPAQDGTTQQQQESGLYSTDILGQSTGSPSGSAAAWTFTAPAGTTITHLTYSRYLGKLDDDSWIPALRADGNVIPSETCSIPSGQSTCSVGGFGTIQDLALSAHSLSLGVTCAANPGVCTTGASLHQVWASLYAATVTIADTTLPSLPTPTGALWTSRYQQGTQSLTYSATDDTGVASTTLIADGNPSPLAGGDVGCDYTRPAPCPNATNATLTLDTTRLTDGPHTLALTSTDPAGNPAALSHQITVDNHGPPPPTGLHTTPIAPGANTVTLFWTDPANPPAPITGGYAQICQGLTCAAAQPIARDGQATATVPGPGAYAAVVWLLDSQGKGSPANAAKLQLLIPARRARHHLRVHGSLLHGRLNVASTAPAGAHGKIRLAYRAIEHHHTVAKSSRRVRIKRGQAHTSFLVPSVAHGAELIVTASYAGPPRQSASSRV
jgi:hypothetical protein